MGHYVKIAPEDQAAVDRGTRFNNHGVLFIKITDRMAETLRMIIEEGRGYSKETQKRLLNRGTLNSLSDRGWIEPAPKRATGFRPAGLAFHAIGFAEAHGLLPQKKAQVVPLPMAKKRA